MTLKKKMTLTTAILSLLSPFYAIAASTEEQIQLHTSPSTLASIWRTCSLGKYESNPNTSLINLVIRLKTASARQMSCVKSLEAGNKLQQLDENYLATNITDNAFRNLSGEIQPYVAMSYTGILHIGIQLTTSYDDSEITSHPKLPTLKSYNTTSGSP